MGFLPSFSIVIPAYNEEKRIGDCLRSATNLDYPKEKLEIIVVDDGSTDKTPTITSKFDVKVIKGPHKGVGIARNLGWKKAKGEIIFFFDADQKVEKKFLKKMAPLFIDKNVAAADCHEEVSNKEKLLPRLHYLRTLLGIISYDFPFAKLCRKKVLKELGGINPKYGYYDDWELTFRIRKKGYKIIRNFDAVIYHGQPENFHEVWRQNKWAGRSVIFLFDKYKKEMLRKLTFPAVCAPVPFYIIFLFLSNMLKTIGILGITIFIIIEASRIFKMFKRTKWIDCLIVPLFDIFTMILYAAGILIGLSKIKNEPKA